jgi:hypothetical protein
MIRKKACPHLDSGVEPIFFSRDKREKRVCAEITLKQRKEMSS